MRIATLAAVLILPIVLVSACGEKSSPEEREMHEAVYRFTTALNGGHYAEAYGMFSNRCRQGALGDEEQFAKQWKDILSPETGEPGKLAFIDLKVVSQEDGVYKVETTFELTRGLTTYSFGSESDPFIEQLVNEDGVWRIDDEVCESPPSTPSGSPTPSAESPGTP